MNRRHSLFVLAAAAVALTGCNRKCGIVSTTIATGAVANADGITIATFRMLLREEATPDVFYFYGSVESGVDGIPSLGSHVTGARLVAEDGTLLAEFQTTDTGHSILNAVVRRPSISQREFVRLRDALLSTRARLVVDTDLAGIGRVEKEVRNVQYTPVDTPSCPGY